MRKYYPTQEAAEQTLLDRCYRKVSHGTDRRYCWQSHDGEFDADVRLSSGGYWIEVASAYRNPKTWSVQMMDQNGRYFIIAGDMFEHDARRWFDTYCERANDGDTLRLCDRHHVIKYSWEQRK